MALNKVFLIGNVGKDPEIRYIGNQADSSKVAQFTLATTEKYKDKNGQVQEATEWHNIVAWRNLADIIEKYVRKGSQLYIEGKIKSRSWTDQQGNKKYATDIVADNLQMLGRKPDGAIEGARQLEQRNAAYQQQPSVDMSDSSYMNADIPDDDLPF